MDSRDMKKAVQAAQGKKTSPKKVIIITSSVAVVLAVGIALTVVYWPKKAPDPRKMERDAAVKYAASKDFTKLPKSEQLRYFENLRSTGDGNPREFFRNSKLTDAEREQLRANAEVMFRQRMEDQAKKLLAMTQAEREKEYDRIADEIRKRMAERGGQGGPRGPGGPGGGGQGGGPGGGGGNNVARMQQRYEGTTSDTRAMMVEMRKAIQKRLQGGNSAPPAR